MLDDINEDVDDDIYEKSHSWVRCMGPLPHCEDIHHPLYSKQPPYGLLGPPPDPPILIPRPTCRTVDSGLLIDRCDRLLIVTFSREGRTRRCLLF